MKDPLLFGVDEKAYLNAGAPPSRDAQWIGHQIGDRITKFLVEHRVADPSAARMGLGGIIWDLVDDIRLIGIKQGRALERADGVFNALFPTHDE